MLKGHLDMIVLAALSSGPAHGYGIIQEIYRRTGGAFELPEGTVYPALHRLEQAGLPKGGKTKLFIQLIDFLRIRRRPDPARYFGQLLKERFIPWSAFHGSDSQDRQAFRSRRLFVP